LCKEGGILERKTKTREGESLKKVFRRERKKTVYKKRRETNVL